MPNAADFFSGKYATAAQLPTDRRITAVIHAVTEETMELSGDTKLVLHLSNAAGKRHKKGIVLNATNGKALMAAYGANTDAWKGRQVEVWAEPTTFAGKPTMGIRLQAIGNGHSKPMPTPSPEPDPWEPGGGDLGDSIPF